MSLRDDGRPEWWFDGVREPDGAAYAACGEGLGASLPEARDAAMRDARRTLRDRLGEDVFERDEYTERVPYSLALPLPNPGGPVKHAGYVKLTLVEPGSGSSEAPEGASE